MLFRAFLIAVSLVLAQSVQASAAPLCKASCHIPILMYHHVRSDENPRDHMGVRLSVTPQTFHKQLDALKAAGFHTMTFRTLSGSALPSKPIILTFDDGYDDAAASVLPALTKEGMVGTFFIVSGFVGKPGYMTLDQLKMLRDAGMELGAHTVSHKDLSKLSVSEGHTEIAGSADYLTKTLHVDVRSFAYPSGKYRLSTQKIIRSLSIPYAVTTHAGVASDTLNPLALPRVRMQEKTSMKILIRHLTSPSFSSH